MTLKEDIRRAVTSHMLTHNYCVGEPLTPLCELVASFVSKALQEAEEKCRSEMAGAQAEEMSRYDEGYDVACANNAEAIREVREGLK